METTIYFLRHGITESNRMGVWQLSMDEELSSEGLSQAEAVSGVIRQLHPDVIVSSPMKRALKTAKVVSASVDAGSIVTIPELSERRGGVIEGLTSSQILEKFGIEMHLILDKSIDRLPGVESISDFRRRVMDAVNIIDQMFSNRKVLAVTHGGVMRAFYTFYVSNNGERKTFRNCSILGVRKENGIWESIYSLNTEYRE